MKFRICQFASGNVVSVEGHRDDNLQMLENDMLFLSSCGSTSLRLFPNSRLLSRNDATTFEDYAKNHVARLGRRLCTHTLNKHKIDQTQPDIIASTTSRYQRPVIETITCNPVLVSAHVSSMCSGNATIGRIQICV